MPEPEGLIDDPVLGQGRDPRAPLQDVINDEGDIVVPVDPRYVGLWLTGPFGNPSTTILQIHAQLYSWDTFSQICDAVCMPKSARGKLESAPSR